MGSTTIYFFYLNHQCFFVPFPKKKETVVQHVNFLLLKNGVRLLITLTFFLLLSKAAQAIFAGFSGSCLQFFSLLILARLTYERITLSNLCTL